MNWFEHLTTMQDRYIGNIAALILVGMLFAANHSKSKGSQKEYKVLLHLIGNIGLYALAEILSDIFDGMPGTGITVLLYILNSILFLVNMILGFGWVQFIALHLSYTIPKRTWRLLLGLSLLGTALLIINIFVPVAFVLQDNVYYECGILYAVFIIIAIIYFLYTIYIYVICRRNGGVLKYFPVWMYIVPSVLGMLLETWLGSSLISICNAIALSAVLASLQQEDVFRDRLTGLYNRAYLEALKTRLGKTDNPYVSGIMLDLNGFKGINDSFGHAEGDEALILAAGLIRTGTGSYGDVIRYAGDEFVVILNTWDKAIMERCVAQIRTCFAEFNARQEKPYQLSVSMGYANFNTGTQTVNEFMNMIDRNMYENKREYYNTRENDRRKS